MLTGPGTETTMASQSLRPDAWQVGDGKLPTSRDEGARSYVAVNERSSANHLGKVEGGAGGKIIASARADEEGDSSDEEATDSGSASDSEEETIISDEVQ